MREKCSSLEHSSYMSMTMRVLRMPLGLIWVSVGTKTISCFGLTDFHTFFLATLIVLICISWGGYWFVFCFLCQVKLQKHNTDVQGLRYKNGLHCASRILQTEGVCIFISIALLFMSPRLYHPWNEFSPWKSGFFQCQFVFFAHLGSWNHV